MSLSNEFKRHFAAVLADAKSEAPQTPLSLAVVQKWNRRLFEDVDAERAGAFRTEPATTRWPVWSQKEQRYLPRDLEARKLTGSSGALAWLNEAYVRYERVLPNVIRVGDTASALAAPVAATLAARPFQVGNMLTAAICLNVTAKRANLELSRIDWADQNLRCQIYHAIRDDGQASLKPLARYIETRLGTTESAEGSEATDISNLDQVGKDGASGPGHANGQAHAPQDEAATRRGGGGPRSVRRRGRRPPLPPPQESDYP